MSLGMTLGKKESIYKVSEEGARLIHLESLVLNSVEMEKIESFADPENGGFGQSTISTRYDLPDRPSGIKEALDEICDAAVQEVREGSEILVMSDKALDKAALDSTTYVPVSYTHLRAHETR